MNRLVASLAAHSTLTAGSFTALQATRNRIEIVVRQHSHVERGLRFRRNDVDAITAAQNVRRHRGAQHRGMRGSLARSHSSAAAAFGSIDITISRGLIARGNLGEPREVRPRRLVEPDVRMPRADLGRPQRPGARWRSSRAEPSRALTCPRATSSMARGIFSIVCTCVAAPPPSRATPPPSARQYLGVDLVEVLVDHELDADAGRAFLAGLGRGR